MARFTRIRNYTVERIYLIGPREEGLALARRLYALCMPLGRAPCFLLADRLTRKLRRQFYNPLCSTGILLFGEDAAANYDALLEEHPWIKVMRLLPIGAPPPDFFFSYHEQIFPCPQTEKDFHTIQCWMGVDDQAEWPAFEPNFPGALTQEELEAAPDISPQGGPT